MRHHVVAADDGGFAGNAFGVGAAVDPIRSLEPLGYAAVVLTVAALGISGWWLGRRSRRPPGVRLRRALGEYDEVTVLLHPNPDPDAMSCAMGVAEIASSAGTDATLQFPGEIRHQENRAFRTVLGLDLERIDSASELAADAIVLVDHNTARGFTDAGLIEPIAVVDHHPGNGTGSAFTDVRTDYGAASTIVAEYFEELGAKVGSTEASKPALELTPELATGLRYGIQSDTNSLTNGCSQAEFDACAHLYDGIDEDLLDRVADPQVSDHVLRVKARAITERRVEGPFAVCDVGDVETVDAIPHAADELMHLEGITAVIVYGQYDGTIHLSGRSRDDRVLMGETIRRAVSDVPMADAGGHARMGGGQVAVDHTRGIGSADGLDGDEFEDRLFAAMAGNRR